MTKWALNNSLKRNWKIFLDEFRKLILLNFLPKQIARLDKSVHRSSEKIQIYEHKENY